MIASRSLLVINPEGESGRVGITSCIRQAPLIAVLASLAELLHEAMPIRLASVQAVKSPRQASNHMLHAHDRAQRGIRRAVVCAPYPTLRQCLRLVRLACRLQR